MQSKGMKAFDGERVKILTEFVRQPLYVCMWFSSHATLLFQVVQLVVHYSYGLATAAKGGAEGTQRTHKQPYITSSPFLSQQLLNTRNTLAMCKLTKPLQALHGTGAGS